MKRKYLVLILAVVFALSMASPVRAGDPGEFFADVDDWETEFYAEAAYWLGRMEIFVGDAQGNLLPEEPLTRAQMAAVLARMTGQESLAGGLSHSSTSWSDDDEIPDWAQGYMVLAEARGWFVGHPDGTVGPNENLTFEQIAILLARVTDNEDLAVGSWPGSAMIAAEEMGLFDEVEATAVGLPIMRGEMVFATLQAMVADTFMKRDAADGGPGLPLMSQNFDEDYDDWLEEVPETVTGEWTNYLSASQRITVAETNYSLHMDGDDPDVQLTINDEVIAWTTLTGVFNGLKGEEITITLNSDDEVTEIEAVLDTYSDVFLTEVQVVEDEEDFGEITVDGDTLDVDSGTIVLLDGEAVTLAGLEDALDAFMEYWETDRAIATARTYGDEKGDGKRAIWVSVITDNIAEGEVTGMGTDSAGGFVRIEGVQYYYHDPLTATDFTAGDSCAVLLDSSDTARLILEMPASTEASEFFGMLVNYEVDAEGDGIATFELSDGTEMECAYDGTVWTLDAGDIDEVKYVVHDGSDFTTLTHPASATQAISDEELVTVTSTYIQTDDGTDTTTLVLSNSVFAYDLVSFTPGYVDLEDLVGENVHVYVDSEGRVGYVFAAIFII
ncbi:MAG: S-layer homology domain-containing protein [Bacillota bacterium]